MIVLGFYKYVDIADVEVLADKLREFCRPESFKGTILLSNEGINASISANRDDIDSFRSFITAYDYFSDLFFKEEETYGEHPFKKMKIKIKKEIVRFEQDVDLANRGRHITAEEFVQLYDNDGNLKEDVILIDTRNDYEYEVGHFKGATHFNLQTFREFADKLDLESLKNKKVVMYCTGGIRCEKASAYVKEQGIENVSQLNQGIIQFGKEFEKSVWQGKCFVFDKRMVSPMNSEGEPISTCYICGTESDFQRNCKYELCNRFYVSCSRCEEKLNKCCSKDCMEKIMHPTKAAS